MRREEKLKVESSRKCGCQPWFLANTADGTNSTADQVELDQFRPHKSLRYGIRSSFSQVDKFCSPVATECFTNVTAAVFSEDSDCKTSCTGLYADVQFVENKPWDEEKMDKIIEAYRVYQARFGINLEFQPDQPSLCK